MCLLGIGDHADHVIVRRAAEATGAPLTYVADFPYVVEYPETIEKRVGDMQPEVPPISEAGVGAWTRAVAGIRLTTYSCVWCSESGRSSSESTGSPCSGIQVWKPPR